MRYFIDTNIFLFLCSEEYDALVPKVIKIIKDFENMFYMSSMSLQEIAVLLQKGRIGMKGWNSFDDVLKTAEKMSINIRYVAPAHIKTLYGLKLLHYDPVDVMIISQAITEDIHLISSDEDFEDYMPQGLKLIPNYR